jgi:aquaporin Z
VGTFLLVLATLGSVVADNTANGSSSLVATSLAPGLVLMAVIYSIGGVSGAHVNPTTTLSYALRRNFPWRRVPGYLLAQFVGAVSAAALLRLVVGSIHDLGAFQLGPGMSGRGACLIEGVLSFGMITVTLGTASGENNVGPNAAIARGGYIVAAGLWAGTLTGASMNPARSLAAALVSGSWSHAWIYVAGPLAGGVVAVGTAWILRGPPSRAAGHAAQGLSSSGSDAGEKQT